MADDKPVSLRTADRSEITEAMRELTAAARGVLKAIRRKKREHRAQYGIKVYGHHEQHTKNGHH